MKFEYYGWFYGYFEIKKNLYRFLVEFLKKNNKI